MFGTPVSALKVPESVSQQIITDMSSGKGQSCFTQDGLEINKLESKLADNFGFLSSVDLEVFLKRKTKIKNNFKGWLGLSKL